LRVSSNWNEGEKTPIAQREHRIRELRYATWLKEGGGDILTRKKPTEEGNDALKKERMLVWSNSVVLDP